MLSGKEISDGHISLRNLIPRTEASPPKQLRASVSHATVTRHEEASDISASKIKDVAMVSKRTMERPLKPKKKRVQLVTMYVPPSFSVVVSPGVFTSYEHFGSYRMEMESHVKDDAKRECFGALPQTETGQSDNPSFFFFPTLT